MRTILATITAVLLLGSSAVAQGTTGQEPGTAPSVPQAQPRPEPGAGPAAATAKGCGTTGPELAARDPMASSACPSPSEASEPSSDKK